MGNKLTTTDLSNLTPEQSAAAAINANFDATETAMEKTLSRDGTSPNQMEADLDMNSNQIINLVAATTPTEPVRLAEFEDLEDRVTVVEVQAANIDASVAAAAGYAQDASDSADAAAVSAAEAAASAGGAVTDAEYIVGSAHANLSAERVATDTATVDVDLGTVAQAKWNVIPGGVDHDALLNFVANEHIDHSGVTITAGAGLTGGGTIESTRTIDVGAGTGITVNANDVALDTASTRNTDHAGVTLTAGAGLTGGGDISASRSFDVGAGTGITVNANDVALTVPVAVSSGGTGQTTEAEAVGELIQALSADTMDTTNDFVAFYDASADTGKKISVTNFVTGIEADVEASIDTLANLTSIQGRTVTLADAGADAVLGWDDSADAYENLTASEVLEIIKTVDGSGSGLDADTLDGVQGADYLTEADAATLYQPLDSDLTSIAAVSTTAAGRSALTVVDNNLDQVLFWDDSAATVKTAQLADITAEAGPAAGDQLLIYRAEGDLVKVDWNQLPGAGGGISNVVEDTTPQLGGDLDANAFDIQFDDNTGIRDDSDNEQLIFQKTASAVNHVEITNAATGNAPSLTAVGDDTNIDLKLDGQGTGRVVVVENAYVTGTLDLGNTSDTTLARSSAGNISVEGNVVYRAGGTDVALADGGTGASLSDPNADRIMFWDDSAGAVDWLTAGTGLSISGTTLSATATSGMTRRTITGADTIVAGDKGNVVEATSGTFTLAFTAAATLASGFWCIISNSGTGVVTLDPDSTEQIDGATSWKLYSGGTIVVVCTGSAFESYALSAMTVTYDADDTWTKPLAAGLTTAYIQGWGGGGGGSSGATNEAGGGGGGGSYNERTMALSAMGTTETVDIGAGGASVAAGNDGNTGNNTTLGSLFTAFAGGGGGHATTSGGGGGGGGGVRGIGASCTTATGALGGEPRLIAAIDHASTVILEGAASAAANTRAQNGLFSGGGGATVGSAGAGGAGGNSWWGGGGGGSGRDTAGSGATNNKGGDSVYGGGGGGGGALDTAGGNAGTSVYGGAGGAGATGAATGGNGTQPGGGGGGAEGANSGAGAAGRLIITVY